MRRIQAFLRWLFPATARTTDVQEHERVMSEYEWRLRDEKIWGSAGKDTQDKKQPERHDG